MDSKNLYFGIFIGVILAGCVSANFPFNWYYPDFVSYEGKLLGKHPSDDIDAKRCAIDPITKEHGCVVMLKPEFEALTQDYLDVQEKLITCERRAN